MLSAHKTVSFSVIKFLNIFPSHFKRKEASCHRYLGFHKYLFADNNENINLSWVNWCTNICRFLKNDCLVASMEKNSWFEMNNSSESWEYLNFARARCGIFHSCATAKMTPFLSALDTKFHLFREPLIIQLNPLILPMLGLAEYLWEVKWSYHIM